METSTSRNRYCSIKTRQHLPTTGKDSRDLTEHVCEEIEHIPSSLSRRQRQTAHGCKPVLRTCIMYGGCGTLVTKAVIQVVATASGI